MNPNDWGYWIIYHPQVVSIVAFLISMSLIFYGLKGVKQKDIWDLALIGSAGHFKGKDAVIVGNIYIAVGIFLLLLDLNLTFFSA